MIWLRSALFNTFFFGVTFVMTLMGTGIYLLAPARSADVARVWARVIIGGLRLICGIDFTVLGAERLPRTGPALIASQHQSTFDTLVWITLLPRCCYVLKRELLRIPLFGRLIPAAGMIAIDRRAPVSALRALARAGAEAVRQGRQIVIFPEGTRAEPGQFLALQPGVAALAARTNLPVIPVATDSGLYWGRRAFRKRPGTIRIRLHQPLPPELPRAELMQRLTSLLREL
ncbi:MAG: 1-acyl-sn-glycerol-3-phosphate acyltransferase [Acetobacteraceae bacterium]|nr:1-acyl-sn-glycerol-3-phosphate acyltransferase [Acetobacteraceae bacterium]